MLSWKPRFEVITPRALKVLGKWYHALMLFQIAVLYVNLMIWINLRTFYQMAIKVRSATAHLWTKDPAGREGEWANNRRLLGVAGLGLEDVVWKDFFFWYLGPTFFGVFPVLSFTVWAAYAPWYVQLQFIPVQMYSISALCLYHWAQCLSSRYLARTVCLNGNVFIGAPVKKFGWISRMIIGRRQSKNCVFEDSDYSALGG